MMTQSIITAGDSSSGMQLQSGDDGTLVLQSGPAGAKLNALSINAAGRAAFIAPPIVGAGTAQGFSAYQSAAQTFSSSVKLQMNTFDGGSGFNNVGFDNVTNFRYTPTVGGLYQVNGAMQAGPTAAITYVFLGKNGVTYKLGSYAGSSVTTVTAVSVVSAVVYLNGTTDYIELFGSQSVSQANTAGAASTYFNACLLQRTS